MRRLITVACWHHKDEPGVCYPLTIGNINYWAARIVSYSCCADELLGFSQISDPEAESENEKPLQLNLTPSHHSSQSRTQLNSLPQLPMMPFPYFPPPHMYFPLNPWPVNSQLAPSTSQPAGSHQNSTTWPKSVKGPVISTWLCYCDNHPDCCGENLTTLTGNFDEQGYQTINQLTSACMSIENLSSWIKIGKGTADYIIQYADEDMALVNDGKFAMTNLPNIDESGDGWLLTIVFLGTVMSFLGSFWVRNHFMSEYYAKI